MKKISKKDLKGLKQLFPMLGKEEMRHYVGGYLGGYWSGNWNGFYSYFDYGGYTGDNGYYYDGSGYRLPEVTIYGYYPYQNQDGGDFWPIFPTRPWDDSNTGYPYYNGQSGYGGPWSYYGNPYGNGDFGYGYYYNNYYGGGSNGSSNVYYYTQEEYDTMVANGTWNGGYVQGWGYVGKDVNAFSGVGEYCTFPEYLRNSSNDVWDVFVDKIVGMVLTKIHKGLPVVKEYTDYLEDRINQVHNEMQADLLIKGYDASSNLFVGSKPIFDGVNSKVRFSVYNADTGQLILCKDMDVLGNIYY